MSERIDTLTVDDVAALLGMPATHMQRLVENDRVPGAAFYETPRVERARARRRSAISTADRPTVPWRFPC